MIIALALTLCLTMLVVATQLEVVTELGASRTERDYEIALQMAEAGANAYQHRLTFGTAAGQPGASLLPPLLRFPTACPWRSATWTSAMRWSESPSMPALTW
jgi:hypothetical protein